MIIRLAKIEDIEPALGLIKEFQEEVIDEYNILCDDEVARSIMTAFVSTTLIAEKDGKIVGLLAGTIVNYPLNKNRVFQEVLWFVTKQYRKYGILLLNEAERYAKEVWGCIQMIMVHMGNSKSEKLEAFYLKRGYKFLEAHYLKRLVCQ